MNKQKLAAVISQLILLTIMLVLIFCAFKYKFTYDKTQRGNAVTLNNVTLYINNEAQSVHLPYKLTNLPKDTSVTLKTNINSKSGDVLYIKSVYTSSKIYVNDKLLLQQGDMNNYPPFMKYPATETNIIPLNIGEGNADIRIEFSPSDTGSMTIHPIIMGNSLDVAYELLHQMGIMFIFSLLEIILGILLIIIAVSVMIFEPQGRIILWLGAFSFASGIWAFGECNITLLIIKNPALLYLFAFIGLFTLSVPILYFSMYIVDFKKPKPVFTMAVIMTIVSSVALLLQLLGIVPLFISKYFIHVLTPLVLLTLTFLTVWEYWHYKNIRAKRFLLPIAILALSALTEVFNYQIKFTYMFSSMFQLGVLFFIIFSCITSGLYIKDAIYASRRQKQLTHEMKLMEIQIEEQQKRSLLIAETAKQTKQQQHDLRHQLTAIKAMASKDNKELCSYIDTLIQNIPKAVKTYCDNPTVNAIVSRYAYICEQNGIDFTVRLVIPQESKSIDNNSLCVIFGNLLENAVEACKRIEKGQKFITLKSSIQYDILTITMDNSFNGEVNSKNGKFLSSKRNDYGIGLSSIQSISIKHKGNARFEPEGNIFHSSVYVKIK